MASNSVPPGGAGEASARGQPGAAAPAGDGEFVDANPGGGGGAASAAETAVLGGVAADAAVVAALDRVAANAAEAAAPAAMGAARDADADGAAAAAVGGVSEVDTAKAVAPETGDEAAGRVTASEIARDWGTSRAYACSCIKKKGCPTDSLEAARKWRLENAKYGIGYRSKGRAAEADTAKAAAPGTVDGEKAAETKKAPPVGEALSGSAAGTVAYELGSLHDSLKAAIMVEEESLRLVREAQLGQQKGGMLESRLRAYNVACKNRSEREAAVREELERQRIMVRMDEAKELFGRGWKEVVPKLRALGSQIGIRCNQADPLLAATTIDYEIAAILKEGEKAYAA